MIKSRHSIYIAIVGMPRLSFIEQKKKEEKQYVKQSLIFLIVVRLTGLEPARRETLDPKSNASTNSATGAFFAEPSAKVVIII